MKRTFLLCSLSIAIAFSMSSAGAATIAADDKAADKFSNIDNMINGLEMASNGGAPAPVPTASAPVNAAAATSLPIMSESSKHAAPSPTVREVPVKTIGDQAKLVTSPTGSLPGSLPEAGSSTSSEPAAVAVNSQARSSMPTLSERLAAEEAEREAAAKKNGETRVSDLPPYSRFDFVRDLFIPANKSGIIFIDGKPSLGIESTADPVRVMMERPSTERVCALISDKNYVMMRGSATGTERSFLELAAVSFMEWSPAEGAPGMFVNLRFAPKPAKGVDGKDVNISLQCRIPASNMARMSETTLNQVNEGFGGLFSFQLPQIIEI